MPALCDYLGMCDSTFYNYMHGDVTGGNKQGIQCLRELCTIAYRRLKALRVQDGLTGKTMQQTTLLILSQYGYTKTDRVQIDLNVTIKDTGSMSMDELIAEIREPEVY